MDVEKSIMNWKSIEMRMSNSFGKCRAKFTYDITNIRGYRCKKTNDVWTFPQVVANGRNPQEERTDAGKRDRARAGTAIQFENIITPATVVLIAITKWTTIVLMFRARWEQSEMGGAWKRNGMKEREGGRERVNFRGKRQKFRRRWTFKAFDIKVGETTTRSLFRSFTIWREATPYERG